MRGSQDAKTFHLDLVGKPSLGLSLLEAAAWCGGAFQLEGWCQLLSSPDRPLDQIEATR